MFFAGQTAKIQIGQGLLTGKAGCGVQRFLGVPVAERRKFRV
jgi:hypothetical protein